jgi:hypothetical protein
LVRAIRGFQLDCSLSQPPFWWNGVLLFRHEDDAEAAFADLLEKPVGANDGAGTFKQSRPLLGRGQVGSGRFQEIAEFPVHIQQGFDPLFERRVTRADSIEVG